MVGYVGLLTCLCCDVQQMRVAVEGLGLAFGQQRMRQDDVARFAVVLKPASETEGDQCRGDGSPFKRRSPLVARLQPHSQGS